MGEIQVLSVRLPVEVLEVLTEKAAPRAVSEYAAELLAKAAGAALSGPAKAHRDFKNQVLQWVGENFDSKRFPRDAIHKAFIHAASNARLRRLHDTAICGEDGQPDRYRKATLHRQTGQGIRRVLGAEVDGRSAPLDGSAFIESFTYLVPGASE